MLTLEETHNSYGLFPQRFDLLFFNRAHNKATSLLNQNIVFVWKFQQLSLNVLKIGLILKRWDSAFYYGINVF